jgi:hypothetical protein
LLLCRRVSLFTEECVEVEIHEVRGSKVDFEVALRGIGVGLC